MPNSSIYSFDVNFEKISIPLYEWKPVHSASVAPLPDGSLLFNEQSSWDWHLIRISRAELNSLISLRIIAEPLPNCDAEIYINHWGGIDVCRVSSEGIVLEAKYCQDIKTHKHHDGRIEITARFLNAHETISVGTSRGRGGKYQGASQDQYIFRSIDVHVSKLNALPSEGEIVFVDVGARYGLQSEWKRLRNFIKPILFEPDPEEAEALRKQLAMTTPWAPEAIVVASALSNKNGNATLHITRHPGCSSLLEPNKDVLGRYRIAPAFEVMRKIEVHCERYDYLFEKQQVPAPDILKIDTQGFEYEVLEGFGNLLENCLAIELEAHFYQIYVDQKLIGDITNYLNDFDFSLRKIGEQSNFDGDSVEFNLYFTKRLSSIGADRAYAADKLALVEKIWGLSVTNNGHAIAVEVLKQ